MYEKQLYKAVLSSYPGHPWQVDSPSGQAPFHFHLPDRPGINKIVCQLKNKLRLAQDKQYLRDTCPKGKLEFQFFVLAGFMVLIC